MSQRLDQLAETLKLRPRNGTPFDWEAIQGRLGTDVPSDYKQLVDTYGGVRMRDLFVYRPMSPLANFDFPTTSLIRWSDVEELWADEEYERRPPELAVPGSRAIAWGSTGDGVYLYWVADPDKAPDDWTTFVEQGRDGGWEHFDVGCVEFLQNVISGDADSFYLRWVAEEDWTYQPF